jgi:hypothetical protein
VKLFRALVTMLGTAVAIVIATIVLVVIQTRRMGAQGADIKALWWWMLYTPLYWLAILVLLGLSIWIFRRWVFINQ